MTEVQSINEYEAAKLREISESLASALVETNPGIHISEGEIESINNSLRNAFLNLDASLRSSGTFKQLLKQRGAIEGLSSESYTEKLINETICQFLKNP